MRGAFIPLFGLVVFGFAISARAEPSGHWAFRKPVRPDLPSVQAESWCRTPIDRFIVSRLENENVRPSPEASRETLIRRVSLDLTGIAPTPAEVDAFVASVDSDAYENLVDRLLASPHYGERWGRHWLDVARYADSNGYSQDNPRSIWKYRDWVIDALNRDLPFDQFVIEQLAGDLLPDATTDQLIATGFHRNTQMNEEGGIDPEQFRVEAVVDRVATTGTGLLGLSLGCAQCHNHKYDPISQVEYYRFYAFLNNCDEPTLEVHTDPATASRVRAIDAELKTLDKTLDDRIESWIKALTPEQVKKLPNAKLRGAVQTPAKERKEGQWLSLRNYVRPLDPASKALLDQREQLNRGGVTTLILREREDEPREAHVHIKGDFTRLGERVTPGTPAVLPALHVQAGETPDRLDLARWIVDRENPLTARVAVNRMWQHYFGRGIVETENDFGTQGASPTHPALLDWLAVEFQSRGWSQKSIHRLIVTSAVYRQSSCVRPDLTNVDPYNKLLARQARTRLDAEIVRDVALCASGLFADRVGGPSVFPPQPPGVTEVGQVPKQWKVSDGADRYRRGMYTFFFRATPHPLLSSFDAPESTQSCTRRNRSNTPLQSLNLLNDEAFIEFAQALASRTLKESKGDDAARIEYAFRVCTSRTPNADERQTLLRVLTQQRTDPSDVSDLAPKQYRPQGVSEKEFAAWTIVARVLLNLDETITRE